MSLRQGPDTFAPSYRKLQAMRPFIHAKPGLLLNTSELDDH